jgi:hypothetical protein
MAFKTALLLAAVIHCIAAASYNYTPCASSAYLNATNLNCVSCPANQIANSYQSVPIACQCAVGFSPNGNGACSAMTGTCGSSSNTYYPLYSPSGSVNSVNSCGSCAANAYTNR